MCMGAAIDSDYSRSSLFVVHFSSSLFEFQASMNLVSKQTAYVPSTAGSDDI